MTELIEENRSSSPEMFADGPGKDDEVNPHVTNGTFPEQSVNGISNGDSRFEMTDMMVSLTDITLEDAVTKIKEIEQANLLLRDYLRKNNEDVKKQYESLMTLKKMEREKFEQTKAVITALRKENEEMQVKLMEKNENVGELELSLKAAQKEISSLQQVKNDARLTEGSEANDVTDAVYVSVESQGSMLAELKSTIATKEDCIALLQADLTKHKQEVKTYQDSAQQLLKDLESQQALKAATDEENRVLNQELVDLRNKLHEQMHIQLYSTKRELEAQHGKKTFDPVPEATPEEHLSSQSLLTPESLDDLMERAQSVEEAKYDDAEKLKALLEKETLDKQQLEQKIQELSEKVKELTQQNNEAMQKIVVIEKEKSEQIKVLCQDYEAKLTEKAKENLERKQREPANTEDIEVLRSQNLSLIKEVQEAERKNADLTRTIYHKDDRLKILSQNVDDSEQQRLALSHENRMLRQHLEVQINAQRQAHEANMTFQQDYRQLQMSFDKAISDNRELMNLVETYKSELMQRERERDESQRSSANMEDLNRLAAEVIAAEEALSLKDDELTDIRGKYNQIAEEVEILRIQAETYKGDFSCERDSRTKLAQEKAELMEALEKCQQENQACKEELREINQRQFRELQGRLHRRSQEVPPTNYALAEEQPGEGEMGPHLNEVALNSASSGASTIGPPVGGGIPAHYPTGRPISQASVLPQPMGAGAAQSYGLPVQGQMIGRRTNVPVSTMPQQWAYNPRPILRRFLGQEQEPIRLSEEEVGDGNFASLVQYDCPSCGVLFPDSDTLHLHVPDCMDGR